MPGGAVRRTIVFALAGLSILAAAGGLWLRFRTFSSQPVVEGSFYRASQPGAADLADAVRHLGIKSVVNLRGTTPEERWYRKEIAACDRLGLEHRDFLFPNIRSDWPQTDLTRELVRYLETAPRPVLIHCRAGGDRTGWVSGIVRALEGDPLPDVRSELSLARGHLCSSDCRLDRFFDQYSNWLADEGRAHGGPVFREWVLSHYSPGPYAARVEFIEGPRRTRFVPGEQVRYRLRITNRSPESWTLSSEGPSGIRLGARILGPLEDLPDPPLRLFRVHSESPVDLMRTAPSGVVVQPGQHWEADVRLRLPEAAGTHLLQFDMVDEHVHWFSDLGEPGLILEVEITGRTG
jgi:protein tyrosine phosphatase (PTP) superfamily phosphohydrolase (DUF442 family)